MMTQQLEVSILAAPLAAIDRRALSQAWCSALRLAHRGRQPAAARLRAPASEIARLQVRRERALETPRRPHPLPTGAQARRPATSSGVAGDESQAAVRARALRTTLAQRIERAFSDPIGQPRRATLSIGRGNARVVVLLQTRGDRAMLLALCRPELRAVVGRALGEARIGLAARGIGVELQAIGGHACS